MLVATFVFIFSMAQAMGSVLKRLKHSDPNVQLHALTVSRIFWLVKQVMLLDPFL